MDVFVILTFVWLGSGARIMATEVTCQQQDSGQMTAIMERNTSGHWTISINLQQQKILGAESSRVHLNAVPSLTRCGHKTTQSLLITMTGKELIVPQGFTELYGIGYYKLHVEKMKWESAKITCEKENSHLLILNSQAEANAITALITGTKGMTTTVFIGNRDAGKGNWETIFGTKLADAGFADWYLGELDTDLGGEDCGGFAQKKLYDLGCNDEYSFICEYRV